MKNITDKDQLTVAEAGRRGGQVTRDRHGVKFYRDIGSKGGESTKKRYGHLFAELGRRGGRPKRPPLDSLGERLPEKKGGEKRSAPGSSSPS